MAESEHRWSRSKYPLHANFRAPAHHEGSGHDQNQGYEATREGNEDERRSLRRTPRLAELAKVVDTRGPCEHAGNAVVPLPLAQGLDLGLATEYSLGQHRSIEKALEESVTLDGLRQRLQPSTSSSAALEPPAESESVPGEHVLHREPGVAPSLSGPTSSHKEDEGTQQSRHNSSAAPKVASRHRKAYPLQSPASTSNLQFPPSPPSSSSESEPQRREATGTGRASANTETSRTKKAPRRKGYPLQSPASNTNLQHSPSPPPSPEHFAEDEGENPMDQKHEYAQQQQTALAAKAVRQWTRQTYPPQPLDSEPPFSSTDSPHAQVKKSEEDSYPEPIHLPKNIRAATESKKVDNSGRTIVLMLDGTGDKFDNDNSNIVHLVSTLKKDGPSQVTYYQAGIGTYGDGGLSGGFTAAADMAVGASLGMHVREAYHFLMHSYKEGDKICIFGFSRGAYTARCRKIEGNILT